MGAVHESLVCWFITPSNVIKSIGTWILYRLPSLIRSPLTFLRDTPFQQVSKDAILRLRRTQHISSIYQGGLHISIVLGLVKLGDLPCNGCTGAWNHERAETRFRYQINAGKDMVQYPLIPTAIESKVASHGSSYIDYIASVLCV